MRFHYHDKKLIYFYQDNSKFPDTIVHYTKHAGVIVYRAILEQETCTILLLYNFAVHYRDVGFPLLHSPTGKLLVKTQTDNSTYVHTHFIIS